MATGCCAHSFDYVSLQRAKELSAERIKHGDRRRLCLAAWTAQTGMRTFSASLGLPLWVLGLRSQIHSGSEKLPQPLWGLRISSHSPECPCQRRSTPSGSCLGQTFQGSRESWSKSEARSSCFKHPLSCYLERQGSNYRFFTSLLRPHCVSVGTLHFI